MRGGALYDNPQAALLNAIQAQGLDPLTSYTANWMKRRYGGASKALFDLNALRSGQAAGSTNAYDAVEGNIATFQDFVNKLVSGAMGGQSLNQAIGFDPSEALRGVFSPGGGGTPAGLGWNRFQDESGAVDQPAMQNYLQQMQQMLMALSGANPSYARAVGNQIDTGLAQRAADFGAGRTKDFDWIDLILGRV